MSHTFKLSPNVAHMKMTALTAPAIVTIGVSFVKFQNHKIEVDKVLELHSSYLWVFTLCGCIIFCVRISGNSL